MNPDRIGHTGITWPFTPEGANAAVADLASLGFAGFETFGFIIDAYPNGVDGLRAVLDEHGVALVSAYCFAPLIERATASDDIDKMVGWARKIKQLGGSVMVVGPAARTKERYTPDEYRDMVRTLNEVGRRSLDVGVVAAFHPHTGTPVETREEIDQVMGQVDPRVMFFAPDTGQIRKGGSDPVEVLGAYSSLVRHIHLKDYDGGPQQATSSGEEVDRTGYLNYVPLGEGVVDVPALVRLMDNSGFDGWWMVELDGTPAAPRPPREAAAMSKRYLDTLMGSLSQQQSSTSRAGELGKEPR